MASNFDLSEPLATTTEKTNHDRLCRLVKEGGTIALKALFDRVNPPKQLATNLADPNVKTILQSVLRRKLITQKQHMILYPTPLSAVSSGNFDITLLMVLLRNMCNLKQPKTGWDNLPRPSDVSIEADICRIKFYRNKLCHGQTASVSNSHFNGYWGDICSALVRLGADRQAIDRLKTDIMDSELEQRETEEVLDRAREGIAVKDLLQSILKSIFTKKIEEITCSVHENNPIELYCTDCQVPICYTCGLGKHKESKDHVLMDLKDAAHNYKDTILIEYDEELKTKEAEVAENIVIARKSYDSLEENLTVQTKKLDNLSECEEVKKHELREQLISQYKSLRDEMKTEVDRFSNLAQTFKHTRAFIKSLLQIESEAKLMSESTVLTQQINETLRLETEMEKNYDVIGEISLSPTPSMSLPALPSLTFLDTFDVPKHIDAGDTITMDMVALNIDCEKVTDSEHFEAAVVYGDNRSERLEIVSSDGIEETHFISFTASKSGKQEISVKLRGNHIKGSPLQIDVLPTLKLSRIPCRQYAQPDGAKFACSLTTDNHGNLVLGDKTLGRIQIIEKDGREKGNFTVSLGVGSFTPQAVAVSEDDELFCVNRGNRAAPVVVCDVRGAVVRTFGQNKLKGYATGIAIDKSRGIVYVGDDGASTIHAFLTRDGSFVKSFGHVTFPTSISVNSAGDVIVTDSKESNVQVFNSDCEFLFAFGYFGVNEGEFCLPVGLAVDRFDNMYICDTGNHRVQMFDREGKFLKFCIKIGVQYPEYIAISDNRVFVTDSEDKFSVKYLHNEV